MAARGETQADVELSTLVVPAWRLRWQAPELALVLGERALALAAARHDEVDRLRAEALVVFASNRIGRGVRVADRALDALKAAETVAEHETAWLLRIELASCARSVGAPLTGFAAIRPVLEADGVPHALRAAALVQASECLVVVGRGDEPARALEEADRLYTADPALDKNTRLLLRGLLCAVSAAQHRRWGDLPAAIGAARDGLELIDRLDDPAADSGQARGRLVLELVCALMDSDKIKDASEAGTPLLEQPVRAPSASTTGWLRLALATRVHLPSGRIDQARELLRDAAASAERHQLDTLLAESLLALAHVHEVSGELAEALTNLRSAHAAERRRARAVYAVRARLAAEFSGVHRQSSGLHEQLASLLRKDGGPAKPAAAAQGAIPAELKQQLRQWRPTQVRRGDALKVKRSRRAAEDMTVEGLSAARAHAADRWRMVQPFGDADDKTPEPVIEEIEQSDRTVPAAGLIAAAGAMISGRRRAAREAAGEDVAEEEATVEPPAEPESVLDVLKAAGLRSGGRRRAPDTDDEAPQGIPQEIPQWRVEAPSHLRAEPEPEPEPVQDFFASDEGAYLERSGIGAAFARMPALRIPEPEPEPLPEPEPEPAPPAPEPFPSIPVPDEFPAPPEHDLLTSTFLSDADMEGEPVRPPEPIVAVEDREPASPSSRRSASSDLSLAELLAEALVAYETGRRSDEEGAQPEQQLDTDVADWMAATDMPVPVEEDAERTGPITPISTVPAPDPDNETTGPIRRVDAPRHGAWTLPES